MKAQDKYGGTPLHKAAEWWTQGGSGGSFGEAGAEVNAKSKISACTPLHWAASSRDTQGSGGHS